MNKNVDEIRQMVESRLSRITAVAEAEEANAHDVIIGKHAQGVVDAIKGMNGEQHFLEKLLEELR